MTTITDLHSGVEYSDRYEFHPADSELWIRLFMWADEIAEPLASCLMYVRNTGAILEPSAKYGHIIKPVIGAQGWSSREEYERERSPLKKYEAELIKLLGRLPRDTETDRPRN